MPRAKVSFDTVSVASPHQIIGPSEGRLSLRLNPPAVGRVTLSNDPVQADGQGLTLSAGQCPTQLDYDFHGDIVCRAWYGLYSAGASPLSWIEVFG